MKLKFSRHIFENPQTSNLMKICPMGADCSTRTDRQDKQTDSLDEANIRFSQFCEHP